MRTGSCVLRTERLKVVSRMRKVKNKKVIRRLSDRSFREARTRNIIAVIAIALTAMLFTTLFTLGIGTMENFQRETMRQSGGDNHGVIKNITREQYEKLSQDPSIVEAADCILVADGVENEEFLKRHMEAWYYPEYHYEHCFVDIIDGRAPEAADEILMDDMSMELLGMEPKAGQQVTLKLRVKTTDQEVTERTFTITGVTKADPALDVGFAIVSEAYLDAHADELVYTYDQDYSLTGTIRMDITFANSFSIQEKLDKVIENAGYSTDESSPDYVASNANWAYISGSAESDPMTIGAVVGGLLLIILTGYLIIYNIFQISVIRDIHYYGLLKTIGATGRQIKKIIRRQALRLGIMGIPFGLIFGYLIGKGILPQMMAMTSFTGNDVSVSIHPLIFIGSAVFTLLTVWISTGKPARIAAKVSPVEAVRYTDSAGGRKKSKNSTNGGKLPKMALSNLGRNKKRTVLVVCSLSLAIILLNSVFTLTHSFDLDTYLKRFVSTDFQVANAAYFNVMSGYSGADEETISEENVTETFVDYCKSLDGYQTGGRLYMTQMIGLRKDSWTPPDYFPRTADGQPGQNFGGEIVELNHLDEENWLTSFYGMEDFFYSIIEVYKGESDLETLKEKMATGKYMLVSVGTDDYGNVEEETIVHQPGDKVTLTYGDGRTREFEVLALIKDNSYALSNRSFMTPFCYYVPADVFKEMASDQFLMCFSFNADDDKEAAIASALEEYTSQAEPTMDFESKGYWLDQFDGVIGLFTLIGGALSFVIGIIGALNFVNSILTGIVTRQGEFAMLEAIGMTKRQLRRMLILEGLYYAIATIAFSLVFGCLFSCTALRVLSGGLWFMKYHFTIVPMLCVFPVLLILGAFVPAISFRFFKKESVVERLRRFNG